MKLKKVLVLIMAVCLSVSLFAACGSDEGTADATKAPASKAPAASATVAPTVAPTAAPTEAPTEAPTAAPFVEDPAVDAILYRFHHADKYMWEVEDFMTSDDTGVGQTALGAACNYWHEEGEGLAIEIVLEDPYFRMPFTGETGEEFNLSEYPIFKIRLKNETVANDFEMFLGKSGIAPGDEFRVEISTEDTEYKDYIVNLAEIKGQTYVDERVPVKGLRMDALHFDAGELDSSDSKMIYIDYFGFFKTVEEAQNWNPSHVTPVEAPSTEAPSTDAADATEVVEG